MARLEEMFSKLVDVVEHLVNTHVTWNGNLNKDDAKGIIDEVKNWLNGGNEKTSESDTVTGDGSTPTENK